MNLDIYTELKNGATEEELKARFNSELKNVYRKIAEEKEEEETQKQEYIDECREDVTTAMLDYIEAVLGEDWEENEYDKYFDEIVRQLKSMEADLTGYMKLLLALTK